MREQAAEPLEQMERLMYAPAVGTARSSLVDDVFAASWAEGRAMTFEETVIFALEEDTS